MKSRIPQNHWLKTLPVAHRGLNGDGVPENSLTAFSLAMQAGYAIETDLHLTSDGVLVAFHDDTLKRACGVDENIKTKTFAELKELKLFGTEEPIPTFDDLLNLVDGKVPLLIELKSNREKGLEQATVERLASYRGEYALQSFDPFILSRVKKCDPAVLRGQLSSFFLDQPFGFWKRTLLKKMRFNFLSKVDFVSYNCENLPNPYTKKKPLLAWTVRTEEEANRMTALGANLIFEQIRPEIKK